MRRRDFLAVLAAGWLSPIWAKGETPAREIIPLWPGMPPGGGGPAGPTRLSARGALSHIAQPVLERIAPSEPNGRAVLIAAGGGYRRIELGKEAWPAARWLTARGYTAWVLHYRLPDEGWHDGNLVALQDACQAIRIIRQYHRRVSLLGFSAGGHLMGMAATRTEPAIRVDAAALIYPVITLEPPWTKTSCHKVLVGPHASLAQEAAWSVQNFVTSQTPPMFLVQAEDDPVSDPHNTLIMAAACRRADVPVTLLRYPHGGHGFGMGRPGTQTMEWPEHWATWLMRRA